MKSRVFICFAMLFCIVVFVSFRIHAVNDAARHWENIGGSYSDDFVYGLGPRSISLVNYVPGQRKSEVSPAVVNSAIDTIAGKFVRLNRVNISHADCDGQSTLNAIQKLSFNEFVAQDAEFDVRCIDAICRKDGVRLLAVSASNLSPDDLMRLKDTNGLAYLHLWNVPYTDEEITEIKRQIGDIKYKFIRSSGY